MSQIFISHAHEDEALARELLTLLELGAGVPGAAVFCSSQPGQGVAAGEPLRERLRQALLDARLGIALVTPLYFESRYCQCELGALWISTKPVLPLIVPPSRPQDLETVAAGLHGLDLAKAHAIDELRDRVAAHCDVDARSTAQWNARRDEFQKFLPTVYRQRSPERIRGERFIEYALLPLSRALAKHAAAQGAAARPAPWLIVLDVDRQSRINATHGTAVGNVVLHKVRELVQAQVGAVESGQCGDDTFFLLAMTDARGARQLAESLLEQVRAIGALLNVARLWVSASATYSKFADGRTLEDWISCADEGLESARLMGGNRATAAPTEPRSARRWS